MTLSAEMRLINVLDWREKYKDKLDKLGRLKKSLSDLEKTEILQYRLSIEKPHILLKSNYIGAKRPISIYCIICKNISETTPDILTRNNVNGCKICGSLNKKEVLKDLGISRRLTDSEFKDRIKKSCSKDVEVISKYISRSKRITYICKRCNSKYQTYPASLLRGINSCNNCAKVSRRMTHEDFLSKLPEDIEYKVLEIYGGYHNKVGCKCTLCNTKWKAKPAELIRGRGCPNCANKEFRYLYVLKEIDSDLYKIGITKHLSKRIQEIKSCVLYCFISIDDSNILKELELQLHRQFHSLRQHSTLAKSGITEFFELNDRDLDSIENTLSKFSEVKYINE